MRVDDVVVAGPGTTIPGLVARLQRELPVPLARRGPAALSQRRGPGGRAA